MAASRRARRVGLLIRDSVDHQRNLINGILAWHRAHGHWQIHTRGFLPMMEYRELGAWAGDGLIAMVDDARQYRQVLAAGVPAVNCSARLPTPRIATVLSDNAAIGRMAAAHLAEGGFRRFAFVGETRFMHDLLRWQGFREELRARGLSGARVAPVFRRRTHYLYAEAEVDVPRLGRALRRLEAPLGLMAAHDDIGCWVLEACRVAGLRVPEQAAVVGVNNHTWLCELTRPHLSSVAQDAERIGWLAADVLDRLMAGGPAPAEPVLVPPRRLYERGSSDAFAGRDPFLARALQFIRNHGCEGLDVGAVVRHANLSRRALEMRFRRHLGRPIGAELERVRLDEARRLLAETALPIFEVAAKSGYRTYHAFAVAFARRHRTSPSRFRLSGAAS